MYKIKEIEIHRIEGLSLACIETLKMSAIDQFKIIIGRNGSGKSRIMSMVFPLAPPKKVFGVGGYYRNVIELNGEIIEFFIKRVNDSIKCFITNKTKDVKICDAVNSKVYNAYVEELTGLSQQVVRLIRGREDFTKMSAISRKYWLDKFSSNDMTYALSFFQRLKESHRDSAGVIKHLTKTLSDVTQATEDEDEVLKSTQATIAEVRERLDNIDRELQTNPIYASVRTVTEEEVIEFFNNTSSLIQKSQIPEFLEGDYDLVTSNKKLDELHLTLGKVQESHSAASRKLTVLEEELQRHEYYLKNREPLKERMEALEQTLKELKGSLYQYPDFIKEEQRFLNGALAEIDNNYTRIDSICDNLKVGQTRKGVMEQHQKLKGDLDRYEGNLRRYEQTLKDTQTLLDHYNHTEETQCPKCDWRFKPGVTHTNKAQLEKDIVLCNEYLIKLKHDNLETSRLFGEVNEQLNFFNELHEWIMSNIKTPVIGDVIRKIVEDRVIQESPKKMHLYLKNAKDDILTALRYLQQQIELDKVKGTLDALSKTETINIEQFIGERDLVVKELEDYQSHLAIIRNDIEKQKKKIQIVKEITHAKEKLNEMLGQADDLLGNYVKHVSYNSIVMARNMLSDQWIALRERLIKLEENINYRNTLQKQYETQITKQKLLSELIESMSPEKGLLKEYYFNSVTNIVDLMNGYLSDVWTYPLTIKPCPIENGQLSYSFPFEYGHDDKHVDDVSEGSDAQTQIFNIVFRLAAYRALNLNGYPLLLDEPGAGFDEQHRAVFIDFIKTLVEEGEFSQLFLVSHYSDVHSRLNRATFLVVDPEGITLPLVYNENVKIKYHEI